MINSISPLLQTKIAEQTNQTNIQQTKQNSPLLKNDKFELSSKPKNKKSLVAFASIVGGFVLASGIVAFTFKGHIENIQKEGSKIQEAGQKTVDEILKSFNSVKKSKDGSKVIEKFSEDGETLISKSTLNAGFLTIDNFREKTRIEATDGKLRAFYSDVDFLDNGSMKSKKCFNFNFKNNKTFEYKKNYQENADGSWSCKKMAVFKNCLLSKLIKNCQENADGSSSIEKTIGFKNGKIWKYIKNLYIDSDRNIFYDKMISIDNKTPQTSMQ